MTFAVPPSLEARLREIAQREGRDVQVVIAEVLARFAEAARSSTNGQGTNGHPPASCSFPLRGTVLRYDDPTGPALPEEDWESGR